MTHRDKCISLLLQLMEERVYFSLWFQNTGVHNCVKTWHPEQEAGRSHLPLKTRSGEQTGSGVRQRAKCVLPPARLQHPVPKSITSWGLNVQMPEPTGWERILIHATTTTGPWNSSLCLLSSSCPTHLRSELRPQLSLICRNLNC